MLRRSDVRANTNGENKQAGVPLTLYINVADSSGDCKALNGVAADICTPTRTDFIQTSPHSPPERRFRRVRDTIGDNFLRGYQITGRDRGLQRKSVAGQVSFQTIGPGWYSGRAIHIHVRVRELHSSGAAIAGYTTQLSFSDNDNDRVLAGAAPYRSRLRRGIPRRTRTTQCWPAVTSRPASSPFGQHRQGLRDYV